MRSVVTAVVTAVLLSTSIAAQDKFPGPRCVGRFCADRHDSGADVLAQLGHPSKKADLYCYRARDGSGFVALELADEPPHFLDNIFLSDFPHCTHMPKKVMQITSADLRNWKTPEGIGLGASEEEVIKAYGKPTIVHTLDASQYGRVVLGYRPGDAVPNIGNKSMEYTLKDRTRSAEFGIRNGKVAWIAMFR